MPTFTRLAGQQTVIIIPPSKYPTIITHTVTGVIGEKVRNSYTAPPCVSINRREVQDRIDEEEAQAIAKAVAEKSKQVNRDDGYGGAGWAVMQA